VPVVANGGAPQATVDCVERCIDALVGMRSRHRVLVDAGGLVFGEYRRHLAPRGQPRVGDAFFKWLWDNQGVARHCRVVDVAPLDAEGTSFAGLPSGVDRMDPSDRKFVALALAGGDAGAGGDGCRVLNAVDSDWWVNAEWLGRIGVRVENVCGVPRARVPGRGRGRRKGGALGR